MPLGNEIHVHFHSPPTTVFLADRDALLSGAAPASAPSSRSPSVREEASAASARTETALPVTPSAAPDPVERQVARRLEEDRATIVKLLDGVLDGVRRIDDTHRGWLAEWRRAAVELAVTIATRLVHDRVKADDFAVETVVREAAILLGARGPLTVRLHPADLALLESRLGGAPLFADGAGMVVVAADTSQRRGDCQVESSDASVTARLGEQLAGIRQELLRSLGDAEPGS
jgi:hypothetical protein